ncbi:hypothetical protein B4113_3481 [Geobacillus sp. B4113_201601]|nr:hypothetical protein B4113_3481 [Geobacillus sp. B4113_201601]
MRPDGLTGSPPWERAKPSVAPLCPMSGLRPFGRQHDR